MYILNRNFYYLFYSFNHRDMQILLENKSHCWLLYYYYQLDSGLMDDDLIECRFISMKIKQFDSDQVYNLCEDMELNLSNTNLLHRIQLILFHDDNLEKQICKIPLEFKLEYNHFIENLPTESCSSSSDYEMKSKEDDE